MANAIHVDIDNALTDSPPWDQPIPDALREEIASIIAMQVDCTPIFDQITDIACKLLRERGWDAKETWISSALLQRRYGAWGNHEDYKEARAALAQPEPVGVTDEEAQELFNAIRVEILGTHFDKDVVLGYEPVRPGVFARAVLARWGRPITELEDGEIDEEAATVIPWLLEEAAQAADADQPYAAGKLTLAAQLLCERRALAHPEPVGAEPTRRQIMQLADELGLSDLSGSLQLVQEAFRRWGRPALSQPEAVGPTDEELLATQDQAVALFPPVHPPRPDWQKEVNNGDTSLGYWDWVVQQIDLVAEEEKA